MSRLHACAATPAAIAAHFGLEPVPGCAVPKETIEGTVGLAIVETAGVRQLKRMTWGFERYTRAMHSRGKPPGRVGLVADLTNPMWDEMVRDIGCRCLIPITHFANPEGEPGAKTRSWFSVADAEQGVPKIMAWAGFCGTRAGDDQCYAGMTMAANNAVLPTNDRMPVLLDAEDYDRWLHGGIEDVIRFQFREPLDTRRMVVTPTEDRWRSGQGPPAAPQASPRARQATIPCPAVAGPAKLGLDL